MPIDMQVYKLIVKSDLYIKHYDIRAKNIQEATNIAKYKFAKQFKVVGNGIKVSLDKADLKNHIEEILQKLYNK